MGGSVLLLFPPGWGLDVGGPHLGLPLLRGFLERHGVPVEIVDLNASAAAEHGIQVTEGEIRHACAFPSLAALNGVYYAAQNRLDSLGNETLGRWNIRNGFEATGLDLASPESVREFAAKPTPFTNYFRQVTIPTIRSIAPSIVGMSLTVPGQLVPGFELCRLLREEGYAGLLVIGGNLVTRLGSDVLLDWVFEHVDGVVRYQGEYALLDLWNNVVIAREAMSTVRNFAWREADGAIVVNESYSLQVGDFQGPSFRGIALSKYWGIPYVPIVASRGCYYGKCSFCAIPYAWGEGGFLGSASPGAVVKCMVSLTTKWGISRFKFIDEAISPKMLWEISQLIAMRGLECSFEAYARLEHSWLNRTLVAAAARAGLKKLYIGLELAPSASRARLNKGDSPRVPEILSILADHGVKTHLFCMVGFPGTGIAEALDTVEFLIKYDTLIDTVDFVPFSYARHTSVDLIEAIRDPAREWALDYDFRPLAAGVLSGKEVYIMAEELEKSLWQHDSSWLHPVYRLYSPWA